MATHDIRLLIGEYRGRSKTDPNHGDYRWTPATEGRWLTVFWAGTVGGAKRAFSLGNVIPPAKDQHVIVDDMEVGDEMQQMIQHGSLSFWRFSDQYSLEIRDLADPRKVLAAYFKVYMDSGGKTMKSACLRMYGARLKAQGRAVKGGRNIEGYTIIFEPQNAQVEYGERPREALIQQAMAARLQQAVFEVIQR